MIQVYTQWLFCTAAKNSYESFFKTRFVGGCLPNGQESNWKPMLTLGGGMEFDSWSRDNASEYSDSH